MPKNQPTLFTEPLTVSQLAAELRDLLQRTYSEITVVGEVTGLNKHVSGHYYFSLKDTNAVIKCKLWASNVRRIKFEMKNGLTVVIRGQLDFYPPYGECSVIAEDVTPKGIGKLELAFRQLYEKMEARGWFSEERKKPLPTFPKRLGLLTSLSGAVLHDMLHVIHSRWPLTDIWIVPIPVMGDNAAEHIAETLHWLNQLKPSPDLLILARGGGSMEDLWAFNEEVLAHAIVQSRIPIITGIGHETDTTIADLVADYRAATPTAAATKALPDTRDWVERLATSYRRLRQQTIDHLQWEWERLERLRRHRLFAQPMQQIDDARQKTDDLAERFLQSTRRLLQLAHRDLARQASLLAALSPLQVLARGYSLTRNPETGQPLLDAADCQPGDALATILHRGRITTIVQSRELS